MSLKYEWGRFEEDTRRFLRSAPMGGAQRSFVHFLLEPLYKLMSQARAHPPETGTRNPETETRKPEIRNQKS